MNLPPVRALHSLALDKVALILPPISVLAPWIVKEVCPPLGVATQGLEAASDPQKLQPGFSVFPETHSLLGRYSPP